MSVLKRLSRLEMSTHVKECVVLESYAFIDAGIQECCFHFGISFFKCLDHNYIGAIKICSYYYIISLLLCQ